MTPAQHSIPKSTGAVAAMLPAELPLAPVAGLYVHVPFCFHKCHYCDFYSITRQGEQRMSRFVDLALREAELWACSPWSASIKPTTVFFGGGTPTLLPLEQSRRLIEGLRSRFDLSGVAEFTVEANPATVDLNYCRMLKRCGVDRISFGAQSFDRQELSILERHHNPDDVPRSVQIARDAGFARINVDLIYAIPGQDLQSWSRSLESALSLRLSHMSCYGLTYEANTPMTVKKRLGLLRPATDDLELSMLHHTRARLNAAGLAPYEISNYSEPGEECRHNLLYWTGGSYVGIGPSAASHIHGVRFRNRPHLGDWERSLEVGELPASDLEVLTRRQRAGELAMLLLRLTRGLDFAGFAERSGFDARELFADQITEMCRGGLLHADDTHLALTDRGLNVADAVAAEFIRAV